MYYLYLKLASSQLRGEDSRGLMRSRNSPPFPEHEHSYPICPVVQCFKVNFNIIFNLRLYLPTNIFRLCKDV
jgi:hypothetical protein